MRVIFLILAAIVAALACQNAMAINRWYQIEVIVFRYSDASILGDEHWPALQSLPNFHSAIELLANGTSPDESLLGDLGVEISSVGPNAFQALTANEMNTAGIYRRLQNSHVYNPVLHVGWRQPGLNGNRAKSVLIADHPPPSVDSAPSTAIVDPGAAEQQRIEGTIRFQTGKFLHVVADFVNYDGESSGRITEHRRMKLKELHYFDHPLFGVIVQVTPYRTAEQATNITDTEPTGD